MLGVKLNKLERFMGCLMLLLISGCASQHPIVNPISDAIVAASAASIENVLLMVE